MKHTLLFLVLTLTFPAFAAETAARLEQLLKQYPDADTNRDGTLTIEEAQAYAQKLRAQRTKRGTATDADDAGEARPNSSRPAPTHADVSYGPHERNKLDLWLAKSDTPTALVVFIHGGGFVNGSKAAAHASMIKGCLEAGVSFMAINYRFRPSAPIQDILRDCARAIQFVRANATRYNIDPQRIASYGGSAGAGTSLWLAFHPDLADPASKDPILRQSSRIVAAGAINGQATYHLRRWPEFLGAPAESWDRPGEVSGFYGAKSEAELDEPRFKAIQADVDMLSLISKDDPPVFLFTSHPGGAVTNRGHYLHHPKHARAVKEAADAVGVPVTMFFAQEEPRIQGDYLTALRHFLFTHLKVSAPAAKP
jgi:acetyl esterase